MWKDLIRETRPDVHFADHAATESRLGAAERALGAALPGSLRELLLETDGVVGHSGVDTVWSLDQIVEQNRYFRTEPDFATLYMPFDALLFFGDNGGGDHFACVLTPLRPDIFAWDHETDSRTWAASDLRDYLVRSLAAGGDSWYR